MRVVRLSRIALVIAVACFFTLVAFGNITDYDANWQFVSHVMSMDTTFQDPDLMWRAITNSRLQHAAYGGIITWQALTALVLWVGVIRLVLAAAGDRREFAESRGVAIIGLTMGCCSTPWAFWPSPANGSRCGSRTPGMGRRRPASSCC